MIFRRKLLYLQRDLEMVSVETQWCRYLIAMVVTKTVN